MNPMPLKQGSEKENPSARLPFIELYKIIAMFMVIILHVLGQGGVIDGAASGSACFWIAWLMEIGAYCAVNCFGIATGYLMGEKRVKYRRLVRLYVMVLFYTVLEIVLAMHFVGDFAWTKFIKYLLPVTSNEYWYFTAYFCLFAFMPLLNIVAENITAKQFKLFCMTALLLLCCATVMNPFKSDPFKLSNGYSAWWLMVMYLFGAGIRKFDLFGKIPAWGALLGYFVSVFVTWAIKYTPFKIENSHFVSYVSPTIVLAALFLLLFCKKLRYGQTLRKLLHRLSPMVFSVYIIHVNPVSWKYVMHDRFRGFGALPSLQMVAMVLVTGAGIFLACIAIDWLRLRLFQFLRIDRGIDFFADALQTIKKPKAR